MRVAVRVHLHDAPSTFDSYGNLNAPPSTLGNLADLATAHLSWQRVATPFISCFSYPSPLRHITWTSSRFEHYRERLWNRVVEWITRQQPYNVVIEMIFLDLDKTLHASHYSLPFSES